MKTVTGPVTIKVRHQVKTIGTRTALAAASVALAVGFQYAAAGGGTAVAAPSHIAGSSHSAHKVGHGRLAPKADRKDIAYFTVIASLNGNTKGYKTPTSKHPNRTVPEKWYSHYSFLPVIARHKSMVEVRLAQRPNQNTTWIKAKNASFRVTYKALLIDLSKRRIYVFNKGVQKYSFPIGEGRPNTPTPTGHYFVAFHAPGNAPDYGPLTLQTSAHSEVFKTFEGGSDAIIAIHGPINTDAQIGSNGTRVSNGCIRMHLTNLKHVVSVPDGTPLTIVK
jgi:lipoprotein-anchoring transpeptidase ErfK/SrfK